MIRSLLRRWLFSVLFLAGGAASELRTPVAPFCPLPASTQGLRRKKSED